MANYQPRADGRPVGPNQQHVLAGALLDDVLASAECVIMTRVPTVQGEEQGGWMLSIRLRTGKTAHGEGPSVVRALSDSLRLEDAEASGRRRCSGCGQRQGVAEFSTDDRYCRSCRCLRQRLRRAKARQVLADQRQVSLEQVVVEARQRARKYAEAHPMLPDDDE